MKKLLIALAIAGLTLTVPTQAHAIFILDTGPGGATGSTGVNLKFREFIPGSFDNAFAAGRFTTTQSWNITSLEGWIQGSAGVVNGGTVDAVLYGDNATTPDTTNEIFRQAFVVPEDGEAMWRGVSGFSESLAAGDYWLAFEPQLNGGARLLSILPTGTPVDYTSIALNAGPYSAGRIPRPGWAFRVGAEEVGGSGGDPNAIPEPATMMLFGTGLAGAFVRKKLKG